MYGKERGNKETKKQPVMTQKEKKAAEKAKADGSSNSLGAH
jgi:hypothetical protein